MMQIQNLIARQTATPLDLPSSFTFRRLSFQFVQQNVAASYATLLAFLDNICQASKVKEGVAGQPGLNSSLQIEIAYTFLAVVKDVGRRAKRHQRDVAEQ